MATMRDEFFAMTPEQRNDYFRARRARGALNPRFGYNYYGEQMYPGALDNDRISQKGANYAIQQYNRGLSNRDRALFPGTPQGDYSPKPKVNYSALPSSIVDRFRNSGGLRGMGRGLARGAKGLGGWLLRNTGNLAKWGIGQTRGMGISLLAANAAKMMGFNNVDPSMVGAGTLAAESLLYGGANAAGILAGSAGTAATVGGRFVAGAGAVAVPAVAFNTGLSFLTEGASALYSVYEGKGRYTRGLRDEMVDDTRNSTGMLASGVRGLMNPARTFARARFEYGALTQAQDEEKTTAENFASKNKSNEEFTTYERLWARRRAKVVLDRERASAIKDDAKREAEIARLNKEEQNLQEEKYTRVKKVGGWFSEDSYETQVNPMFKDADKTRLDRVTDQAVAERRKEEREARPIDRENEADARRAAENEQMSQRQTDKLSEQEALYNKEKAEESAAAAAKSARDRALAVAEENKQRQKQYEFNKLQTEVENNRYAKLAKNGPVTPAIMDQHRRDMEQVRRLQIQASKETDPGTRAQLNKEIREAKQNVINLNDKASRDPKTNELYTQKQLDAKWKTYEKGEIKKQKAEATQAAKQKASLYLAVAKATGNNIPNSPQGFIQWKSRAIDKLQKKFFLSGRTSSDIDLLTRYGMLPEVAKALLRPMDSDLSDVIVDIMAQQSGKGGGYKYSDNDLKSLRMTESEIVAQREKLYKGDASSRMDTKLKEEDRRRLEVEKEKILVKTLRGSRSFENVAGRALNANPQFRGVASNNLIKKLSSQGIIDPRGDDVTNASKLRLLGMENSASLLYPKVPGGNANLTPRNASSGGVIYASTGKLVNFAPKGTDTVPAMLTPGEFVVNARSTSQHLPLLKAINNSKGGDVKHLNNGGVVNYLQDGGLPSQRAWAHHRAKAIRAIQAEQLTQANKESGNFTPQTRRYAKDIILNRNDYDIFNDNFIDDALQADSIIEEYRGQLAVAQDRNALADQLYGKHHFRRLLLINIKNAADIQRKASISEDLSRVIHGKTLDEILNAQSGNAELEIEAQSKILEILRPLSDNYRTAPLPQAPPTRRVGAGYLDKGGVVYAQNGIEVPARFSNLDPESGGYMDQKPPVSQNELDRHKKLELERNRRLYQANGKYDPYRVKLSQKQRDKLDEDAGRRRNMENIKRYIVGVPEWMNEEDMGNKEVDEYRSLPNNFTDLKKLRNEKLYTPDSIGIIGTNEINEGFNESFDYVKTIGASIDKKRLTQNLINDTILTKNEIDQILTMWDINRDEKLSSDELDPQKRKVPKILQKPVSPPSQRTLQPFQNGGIVYAQNGIEVPSTGYVPFKTPKLKALNDRRMQVERVQEEKQKAVMLDRLRRQLNTQLSPTDNKAMSELQERLRKSNFMEGKKQRKDAMIDKEEYEQIKFALDMIDEYKRFQHSQIPVNTKLNKEAEQTRRRNTPQLPPPLPHLTPQPKQYGGVVYASAGTIVPYQPKGTDTVPAMLTPGEFVVNAKSTAKNLPLLRSINRQNGGIVNYLEDGGEARSRKQSREEEKARLRQQYQDTKLMKQESYYANSGRSVPARLSYPLANLHNRQQEKTNDSSGASSSSPGILELTMFKKAITGTTDLLDRLNQTLTTITSQPNGVSNTAGNGLNLDGLTAFTQKFGEFTVALGKINPIINMKGEHTVNVNINGIEAFKTMQQEFQNLVTVEIQKSMNALSANSEGSIPVQNIG
jgi:hypothetical protein